MKKLLTVTTAAVMAAALAMAGCGSPEGAKGQGTGDTQSAQGTQAQADGGSSGDKIKLVYWSNQRHDMEYAQKKIDEFNSTNDKNIEVSYEVMTENYDNNLELSFQGIQCPGCDKAGKEEPKEKWEICTNTTGDNKPSDRDEDVFSSSDNRDLWVRVGNGERGKSAHMDIQIKLYYHFFQKK